MGRSHGGLTTKVHALADVRGSIRIMLAAGQVHDRQAIPPLLEGLTPDSVLIADNDWIRTLIEERSAEPNIPLTRIASSAFAT